MPRFVLQMEWPIAVYDCEIINKCHWIVDITVDNITNYRDEGEGIRFLGWCGWHRLAPSKRTKTDAKVLKKCPS